LIDANSSEDLLSLGYYFKVIWSGEVFPAHVSQQGYLGRAGGYGEPRRVDKTMALYWLRDGERRVRL